MTTPVITLFNNKGGVGKTSMAYHLAWMLADLQLRVVVADLDPQCNLTAAFLDEDRLEETMSGDGHEATVFGCVRPLKAGTGDFASPHLEEVGDRLWLILGDMALSTFEDALSEVWPKCLARDERAFRITSAFWRVLQAGAREKSADVILVDLGPNLGAINRAALIASDHVVIVLGPDLFSLQGLQNLGPTLRQWRDDWKDRVPRNPVKEMPLPSGEMKPVGYVVLRHSIRLDRPVKAFERWMEKIPGTYRQSMLDLAAKPKLTMDKDAHCLARLKDYRSLMPLGQEVHKPIFFLKPADGAMGAHVRAVSDAYADFRAVAGEIGHRTGILNLAT